MIIAFITTRPFFSFFSYSPPFFLFLFFNFYTMWDTHVIRDSLSVKSICYLARHLFYYFYPLTFIVCVRNIPCVITVGILEDFSLLPPSLDVVGGTEEGDVRSGIRDKVL